MRFAIIAALPVAALLAQAPPPAEQSQPKTEAPAEAAPPAQVENSPHPDALSKSQRDAAREKLQKLLNARPTGVYVTTPGARTIELRPGQSCAVALTNMLHAATARSAPDPLPVTPGSPGAVPLKEIPLPAPSCDDVKR